MTPLNLTRAANTINRLGTEAREAFWRQYGAQCVGRIDIRLRQWLPIDCNHVIYTVSLTDLGVLDDLNEDALKLRRAQIITDWFDYLDEIIGDKPIIVLAEPTSNAVLDEDNRLQTQIECHLYLCAEPQE